MIHSEDFWLERFRSLFDRALALGENDWTVDFKRAGADLLGEFREEYGSFVGCEVCNTPHKFARLQNHGVDDRVKVCRDCDGVEIQAAA